jgi:uncharacterized protein (UPF0332 family)
MTSADDKVLDPPTKPKRVLPRGGKRPSSASRRQGEMSAAARLAAQAKPQRKERRVNPANNLWAKAQAAARSAKLLTDAGDWDGATNRAYYAVFSAARAALAGVRASLAKSKGHSTIVRRFEKHLVQERGLDSAFGRSFFGRLSHARWIADYDDLRNDEAAARAMLGEAERFVAVVQPYMKKAKA